MHENSACGDRLGNVMSVLNPTRPERLVDSKGRPYFLWDEDITLAQFEALLCDPDPDVRAYFLGKLMRQAKPDDVFTFVTAHEIARVWPRIERHLGKSRAFWDWLLRTWERQGHVRRQAD